MGIMKQLWMEQDVPTFEEIVAPRCGGCGKILLPDERRTGRGECYPCYAERNG